jgi:transposase-like protein
MGPITGVRSGTVRTGIQDKAVARSVGVIEPTLERWSSEALGSPAQRREWPPAARFEAVLTTSIMDESNKSAWSRSNGVYPHELALWREQASSLEQWA